MNPLSLPCMVCHAAPGDLCVNPETREPLSPMRNPLFAPDDKPTLHAARMESARVVPSDLAQIKARMDAASPGPWRALTGAKQRSHEHVASMGMLPNVPAFPLVLANNEHVLGELSPWTCDADRALIIHARSDLEHLYYEVRAARYVIRSLLYGEPGAMNDARAYLEGTEGIFPSEENP